MHTGRSKFVRWIGLMGAMALLVPALVACGGPSAQSKAGADLTLEQAIEGARKEGKVYIADSTPEREFGVVTAAFKQKYPFIDVEFLSLGGNDILLRVRQESQANQPTVDVSLAGHSGAMLLEREGHLQTTNWKSLGVADDLVLTPSLAKAIGVTTVLIYNKNLVPEGEVPKGWDDLLAPKWKGKIAVPIQATIPADLAVIWGEEKTTQYYTQLVQNGVLIAGAPEVGTKVAAGEYAIGIARLQQVRQQISRGAPVAYVIPDPVPFPILVTMIPKGAAHPNAARVFTHWLTSVEGANAYDQATGRGNPFVAGSRAAEDVKGLKLAFWDGNPDTQNERERLEQKYTELLQRGS